MKHLKKITIVLIALFTLTLVLAIPACAAGEETPTPEVVDPVPTPTPDKIYTYSDADGTAIFTLKEDGTGTMEMSMDGATATCPLTYIIEGTRLDIVVKMGSETYGGSYTINEDNTLTEIFPEEPQPEPQPQPEENEDSFFDEKVKEIILWAKENLGALKAFLGVTIGLSATTVLTLLGLLIKGLITLFVKNRKEEKESAAQKEFYDKIIEIATKAYDKNEENNQNFRDEMITHINTLDNNKRKEAIEAGQKIQADLDDIINRIN